MRHGERQVNPGGDRRSVTVTFDYDGELHTLVARNRKEAAQTASERWGWGWDGEPVVSTPDSIYHDLTGHTERVNTSPRRTQSDFGALRTRFPSPPLDA